jgi:PD-(D/E)XK nuclease superfamily/Helicase HerA, central domain
MTDITYSVTEVVTATRCARQFVLARDGHRVVPYGPDAFGQAAHVALSAMASGALRDAALHKLLDNRMPDREAVESALFALALPDAHAHAKRIASTVDGGDLARFADTVRHVARLLTPPVTKAAASADGGKRAAERVFLGSEEAVDVALEGVTIRGRIDLRCRDTNETWIWDLKTYAGTDLAQLEQVRLYAMAYAAQGKAARPALVHVVRDRIAFSYADPPREGDAAKLVKLTTHMGQWIEGTAPPPVAPDLGTCRTCPAQATCWRRWGRTLPDEVDGAHARVIDPPEPSSRAPIPHSKPLSSPMFVTATPVPPMAPSSAPAGIASSTPDLAPEPLWIGVIPPRGGAAPAPARIAPIEITRHVAIFGAAGSGKTYLAKAMVEEAILAGVPVLAFDVQGDMLTLAQPLGDDQVDASLRSRRDAYRDRSDVRLITPMSDAGLRMSLNPLSFPARDMTHEHSMVYSEAVAENLLAHVKLAGSWRDHARAYLAQQIRGAMKKVTTMTIEDLIAGIAVDEDVDDPLLDRAQRQKLVKELRLLTIGSKSLLFELGRPLDIEALLAPSGPTKTPLNVIWLNGLGDQQNKQSFVAMVLADVYAWMLRQKGGVPRVLLYFDEIGPYMPPNGEPPSKKLLKQIFKEGRKYGVCGLFCTQNFTDVDYKVVSQASTVAIGRLNAAQEKKKAAESLGAPPNFDVQAAVDNLMGSARGRFVVKRVEGPPHWLQGRSLVTLHGPVWGEEEIRAFTSDEARAAWELQPAGVER